jgi:uncharacterized protein (TIGR02996 family)
MLGLLEEAAFLPSILAHPKADGPRLIFADFLDESSDPADRARAEFIRTQIALARILPEHPRRRELVNRQNDLLIRYHSAWTAHLKGLASGFEFRRGILDSVSVDVSTLAGRGDELFRRAPIRRVRVLDAGRHISRLASCPTLALVRELDVCGNDLNNGGVHVLLRSPYLEQLESLDLSFNGICDGGMQLVARASSLPNLQSLNLNDNGLIRSDGVRKLAESPYFSSLRELDLSGNDISEDGMAALVESPTLTHLDRVRLHANHIGDAGIEILAGSALLRRILAREPRLDLRQNAIGPAGVRMLAKSPLVAQLQSLDLGGNSIGDDGLDALAKSAAFPRLTSLSVRQNRIGDSGILALACSPLMETLLTIDISSNRVTARGINWLWPRRKDWRVSVDYSDNLVVQAELTRG